MPVKVITILLFMRFWKPFTAGRTLHTKKQLLDNRSVSSGIVNENGDISNSFKYSRPSLSRLPSLEQKSQSFGHLHSSNNFLYLEILSVSRTNFFDPCEFEINRVHCTMKFPLLFDINKRRRNIYDIRDFVFNSLSKLIPLRNKV